MEQGSHSALGRAVELSQDRLPSGIGGRDRVGSDETVEIGLEIAALDGRGRLLIRCGLLNDLVEETPRSRRGAARGRGRPRGGSRAGPLGHVGRFGQSAPQFPHALKEGEPLIEVVGMKVRDLRESHAERGIALPRADLELRSEPREQGIQGVAIHDERLPARDSLGPLDRSAVGASAEIPE
jgi:hypothetical protein